MMKHTHTTLVIPDEERAMLQEMAHELGFLQTRGAGAGQIGSISALIRAVAKGNLKTDLKHGEGEIKFQIPGGAGRQKQST